MRIHATRALINGAFVSATIEIEGERIADIRAGLHDRAALLIDDALVPGFIDAHCHGGGGGAFTCASDIESILRTHRSHGVTSMMASLVTDDVETLARQIAALEPWIERGDLIGIHLEGPWLAAQFCGAHPQELLCAPTPDVVSELVLGHPVRMVTVAPELPGAMDAIMFLRAHGIVVAIGHTAADYDTTCAAIAAGATGATHLFNAMPPLQHRDPGPVLALLEDRAVMLELVWDGIHVHPALAAFLMEQHGHRVCLVSDAMAAAGCGDGDYTLGRLAVQVRDGVARVTDTYRIAGSTLVLDAAVRGAVRQGVPLARAIGAVTESPAKYLGLTDVGRIAPNMQANLVVLDAKLGVQRVMRHGKWIEA